MRARRTILTRRKKQRWLMMKAEPLVGVATGGDGREYLSQSVLHWGVTTRRKPQLLAKGQDDYRYATSAFLGKKRTNKSRGRPGNLRRKRGPEENKRV